MPALAPSTTGFPICIVDPYSTGAMMAVEAYKRGFRVVALWTDEVGDNRAHVPAAVEAIGVAQLYSTELTQDGASIEMLVHTLRNLGVAEILCGGETGVKVADALSEAMGVKSNGTGGGMENRRDKRVQQEAVRVTGLRAVREACGMEWDEVAGFCNCEPMPIVVKPVESAGSEGVKLCHSTEEARSHFELLMHSQRKCGAQGAAVLLQEYLKGSEYVIDHVSRDGEHKTT